MFNSKTSGQIITVFFLEANSAIAFSIFYAGLSIYLTNTLFMSKDISTSITGMFLALNYFLPIIGGLLTTQLITYKRLYIVGMFFSFIGCLILAQEKLVFYGLSLILINSLVSKICLRMFITHLFEKEQVSERRVAFLWSYIGMNVGFLIGFFLTGFFTNLNNYSLLFSTMSIFLIISALLCFLFIKPMEQKLSWQTGKLSQLTMTMAILTGIALLITFLLLNAEIASHYLLLGLVTAFGGTLTYAIKNTPEGVKSSYWKFLAYWMLALVFWTAYMLTPTAIMQIIHNNTQNIIFGVKIAPAWFINIDSIVILILASQLALRINKQKDQQQKSVLSYYSRGFILSAVAFFILYFGVTHSSTKIPAIIMLGYLIFMSAAEVFISPISSAIIGELIPEKMQSLMTGICTINLGIGSLLAGYIAKHFILPNTQPAVVSAAHSFGLESTLISIALLMTTLAFISWIFSYRVSKNVAYNNQNDNL